MGTIVGGFATSHILFSPDGSEEQAERVFQGMLQIRDQVRALDPDVLVLIGADHLNNFNLSKQITMAVGVADEFTTLGDGIPVTTFPGKRDFAEGFARFAAENDFEIVQVEEVTPDHGTATPRFLIDPRGKIPTVPIFVNTAMPVPPSPKRCYRLGEVLRRAICEKRPADERVVIVGHGGLSHWVRVAEQGQIAEEFDRQCIELLTAGRGPELLSLSTADFIERSGNGGVEVLSWLVMAGALGPDARGQCIYYEAMPSWMTGMGGISLLPRIKV